MTAKQEKFWKNFGEFIVYSLVGLATTIVSYGVRSLILYSFARMYGIDLNSTDPTMAGRSSALRSAAQTAGWIAGVLFAFLPNKVLVFRNRDFRKSVFFRQFGTFVVSRIGTYFLELGLAVLLPLTLNSLRYRPFRFVGVTFTADILTMVVSIILVTAINYLIGKLIVFRKSRKPREDSACGVAVAADGTVAVQNPAPQSKDTP